MSADKLLALGQTALELGLVNGLTVLALFLSYSMLNVCDLSTDGCFTLGAPVGSPVAVEHGREHIPFVLSTVGIVKKSRFPSDDGSVELSVWNSTDQ